MATMNAETDAWPKSDDSTDYFALLRMPTIGADPMRLKDCVQAATWLKKWLAAIGAEAELVVPRGTGNREQGTGNGEQGTGNGIPVPVVIGELKGPEGATTVLVYGHYDVQPPDPLELWETPPFEPTVRADGRVRARGAQDDKGQFFAFLCGVRELVRERGRLGVNVKFVLEGQEESGSGTLFRLLEDAAFRKRLAADVLLVSDTGAAAGLRPAIVAGLRGVCHFTVALSAANRDLHSGEYGGLAPNAAQGMAELVASLHTPDGAIAVSGFRDGIEPPSHDELAAAEAGFPDEAAVRADIGTEPCGGQLGKSLVQRNGFEPTIEVNGIHSGYGGPGSKTVIPCSAEAKLSLRLVPGQSPAACCEAVRRHLKERCPRGMSVSFPGETGMSSALRLPLASPLFRLAEELLTEMDPRGPVFLWDGASIPVVAALKTASGAAPLLVGWGQPEDRIHAPNESYSPVQFAKAKAWAKKILSAF